MAWWSSSCDTVFLDSYIHSSGLLTVEITRKMAPILSGKQVKQGNVYSIHDVLYL